MRIKCPAMSALNVELSLIRIRIASLRHEMTIDREESVFKNAELDVPIQEQVVRADAVPPRVQLPPQRRDAERRVVMVADLELSGLSRVDRARRIRNVP